MSEEIKYNLTVDNALQELVRISNKDESLNIGITLTVQGLLISGVLCSYYEYAKVIFNKEFEKEDTIEPQYIHLKNAKIFVSGNYPIQTGNDIYWRGKLTSVDGFIFGKLGN